MSYHCEICDAEFLTREALRDPFPGRGPECLVCEDCIAAHKAELAAAAEPATVRITSEDDEPLTCTLAGFLAANADTPALCEAVGKLAVGESYSDGGGAAPAFMVERVR
jgi:hypothetical protein